jgi:hypothetical protein
MPNMPSSEELDTMFQAFKAVLTHPEFQQALTKVQGLPEDQRSQAASTLLDPQALAAQGVPTSGMNITTQKVESPVDPTIHPGEVEAANPVARGGGAPDFRICFIVLGQQYCLELINLPGPDESLQH